MSSYIVDDKTVNRVVWGIENWKSREFFKGQYPAIERIELDAAEEFEECLGRELLALNIAATCYRYNDKFDADRLEKYEYHFEPVSSMQFLKSLQCLLYQASEGNIPSTQLYHDLRKLEGSLMARIISDLPAYEKAEWA